MQTSLRDLLHTKYKSSTKAKKVKRKEAQAKLNDDVEDLMLEGRSKAIIERMHRISLMKALSDCKF